MPLVIIVLAIIAALVSAKEYSEGKKKRWKNIPEISAKTNSHLERLLVDKYMKYGCCFDKAYQLARKDMERCGFTPCIPKAEYAHNSYNDPYNRTGYDPRENDGRYESSHCHDCDQYDSMNVRWARDKYRAKCSEDRKYPNEFDEYKYVYDNFDKR